MTILATIATGINSVLAGFDIAVVRRSQMEDFQAARHSSTNTHLASPPLPAGAAEYLSFQNPRLASIAEAYRSAPLEVIQPSRWTPEYTNRHIDLRRFRGDNAYVFSDRNVESTYVLTAYYVEKIDSLGLLDVLVEDGLFGAPLFEFKAGVRVSRDLVDSIVEIYSLLAQLPRLALQDASILDIGAGYGRLAHRLTRALPCVKRVYCTDAIPVSTFLCEYYLRYRDVDRAEVVPLPDVEALLGDQAIRLATNIHSFSECTLAAIDWWVNLLQMNRVQYLLIVPNPADHGGKRLLSQEQNGTRLDYSDVLSAHGYRRIAMAPKFADEVVQRIGASPTYHHFFELST